MNKHIDRITGLGIRTDNATFTISSKELLQAISEEVDLEIVTDHELKEIIFHVCKVLNLMDWRSTVVHAINNLPFGLNQSGIAWDGQSPCSSECPDAFIEENLFFHKHACKAWEIFEHNFKRSSTITLFKCNKCNLTYGNYYPPDDICLKCNNGTIRIVTSRRYILSTETVDNHVDTVDKFQKCHT